MRTHHEPTEKRINLSRSKKNVNNSTEATPHRLFSDRDLSVELLLFCDFQSLIALKSTSRKLNQYVYQVLKMTVKYALDALPAETDNYSHGHDRTCRMTVRKGWTKGFATREGLIEEALSEVEHQRGDNNFPAEHRAIAIDCLTRLGHVAEVGNWGVKIEHSISGTLNHWFHFRDSMMKDIAEELESEDLSHLVSHYLFTLFYVAEPDGIRLAHLVYTDYENRYRYSDHYLMFEIDGNERIEVNRRMTFARCEFRYELLK